MSYQRLKVTIRLQSPVVSPFVGDMLFGQLCWVFLESHGKSALESYLAEYTQNNPFMVVSDGFPQGYLPRPHLPWMVVEPLVSELKEHKSRFSIENRKEEKKKIWTPVSSFAKGIVAISIDSVSNNEAFGETPLENSRVHNTIQRMTGTTGTEGFAPFMQSSVWYKEGQLLDVYCLIDTSRLEVNAVSAAFEALGSFGYGKDASTGMGKFIIESVSESNDFLQSQGQSYMTLAPSAPQGLGFDENKSYWKVQTKFPKHGNVHALGGRPFKNPLLLADTASVFTVPENLLNMKRGFIGQGIGGSKTPLSNAEINTVHQGYAPVIPLELP